MVAQLCQNYAHAIIIHPKHVQQKNFTFLKMNVLIIFTSGTSDETSAKLFQLRRILESQFSNAAQMSTIRVFCVRLPHINSRILQGCFVFVLFKNAKSNFFCSLVISILELFIVSSSLVYILIKKFLLSCFFMHSWIIQFSLRKLVLLISEPHVCFGFSFSPKSC